MENHWKKIEQVINGADFFDFCVKRCKIHAVIKMMRRFWCHQEYFDSLVCFRLFFSNFKGTVPGWLYTGSPRQDQEFTIAFSRRVSLIGVFSSQVALANILKGKSFCLHCLVRHVSFAGFRFDIGFGLVMSDFYRVLEFQLPCKQTRLSVLAEVQRKLNYRNLCKA